MQSNAYEAGRLCLGRGSSESPLFPESFIRSTSVVSVDIICSVSSRKRPNARTWCIFHTVYPIMWFWLLVQLLSRVLLVTPWTAAHRASLSFPSLRVCSNSCPLSRWCYLTISSSVAPFSSCPQSFPASESFPMSWLFPSGGQSIGASATILPMSIQDWFP